MMLGKVVYLRYGCSGKRDDLSAGLFRSLKFRMVVFGRQRREENSEYLHLQKLAISAAVNDSLLQRTRR
jgi:hypothetical protein